MAPHINKSKPAESLAQNGGRGLLATIDIDAGDVILETSQPYLCVLENAVLNKYCYVCLKSGERCSLQSCAACGVVRYCSKRCQKISWGLDHKRLCKGLKRVRDQGKALPTAVRALAAMLLRLEDGAVSGEEKQGVIDLEDHLTEFMDWESQKEEIALQAKMALMCTGLKIEESKAFRALCQLKVNAFRLTRWDDEDIGLCLDTDISMANHSCEPNAFISFQESKFSLRALNPIKNGDEIYISYIDTTEDESIRQVNLKSRYQFTCTCLSCTNDDSPYSVFLRTNKSIIEANDFSIVESAHALQQHAKERLPKPDYDNHIKFHAANTGPPTFKKWAYPWPSKRLNQAYQTQLDNGNFAAATTLAIKLAFDVHPYQYPQPWHPVRTSMLVSLARLVAETTQQQGPDDTDPRSALEQNPDIPRQALDAFMPVALPCILSLYMLAQEYVSKSHGKDSELAEEIELKLRDWKALVGLAAHPVGMVLCQVGIRDGSGRETARLLWKKLGALGAYGGVVV